MSRGKFVNEHSSVIIKKISSVCARARIESGLKQNDLATAFGCSQQYISAFEDGRVDSEALLFLYISYLPQIRPILDYLLEIHKELKYNGKTD